MIDVKSYYSTGELWYEINCPSGERHGIERGYYQTGELNWETPYLNGKRHGVAKIWFNNGQLDYWKRYHLYGQIVSEEEYREHELIEELAKLNDCS